MYFLYSIGLPLIYFSVIILADKIEVIGTLQCCEKVVSRAEVEAERGSNRVVRSFSGAEAHKINKPNRNHKIRPSRLKNIEEIAIGCYRPRNVTVQLWEEDGFWPFDNHDLLAQEMTDQHGHFTLKGFEEEFLFEDFFLLAYSTCGLSEIQVEKGCKRVSKFTVHRNWEHIFAYQETHKVQWDLIESYLFDDHIGGEDCH